jgi:hypothetical protein
MASDRRDNLERQAERPRSRSIEGFVALGLLLLTCCNPLLPLTQLAQGYRDLVAGVMFLTFASSWLFAIGGIRRGEGTSRLAAWVTMAGA